MAALSFADFIFRSLSPADHEDSSARRALGLPEILRLVCEQLTDDRASLAATARTNHAWAAAALDVLWRHFPPAHAFAALSSPARRDWYAAKVVALRIGDDDAKAIAWPAFPRLRQLFLGRPHCPEKCRPCYDAGLFASAQLESLTAYMVSGIFELLEQRRVRLRHLHLFGLGDVRKDDAQSAFMCKPDQGGMEADDRFYPGCTNSPAKNMREKDSPRTRSEQRKHILDYIAGCCAASLETLTLVGWDEPLGDALAPRLAALQQHHASNDCDAADHTGPFLGSCCASADKGSAHPEQPPFHALRSLGGLANAAAVTALVRPFPCVTQLWLRFPTAADCGSLADAAEDPRHVHEAGRLQSCAAAVMMVAVAAAMPRLRHLSLSLADFVPVPRASIAALSRLKQVGGAHSGIHGRRVGAAGRSA